MKTNKKAISLIVLVITIIVLAILATTVIITLSNTNIIEQANQAAFRADMATYKTAAQVYIASEMARNKTGDDSNINLVPEDDDYEFVFGEVPSKYAGKISIVGGKLVYETEVESEIEVLEEMGIASSTTSSGEDEPIALEPGLYEANTTNLKMSWDELLSAGYITVNDGVLFAIDIEESDGNLNEEIMVELEGDLVIASGVTEIGAWAFCACEGLNRVTLPNTVTAIGELAFEACMYLREVNIPASVNSIAIDAFAVTGGAHLNVSKNNLTYSSIDGNLLTKDGKTLLMVTRMTDYEYWTYTIPESVTAIGERAFDNGNTCDLTYMYFSGTKEEWNNLPKGENWDNCVGCISEVYYISCSDGVITVEVPIE
ncbi:MAG: leucine-rich repeat protein [Clostridia bacterium]|nr:leucine-rich repeat protein [Clostridia bacterium]